VFYKIEETQGCASQGFFKEAEEIDVYYEVVFYLNSYPQGYGTGMLLIDLVCVVKKYYYGRTFVWAIASVYYMIGCVSINEDKT